jgi:hypothetical protein
MILVKEGIQPNPLIHMFQHKAKKLLEKEKEQIVKAFNDGMSEVTNEQYGKLDYDMDEEKYYNKTYNQNK